MTIRNSCQPSTRQGIFPINLIFILSLILRGVSIPWQKENLRVSGWERGTLSGFLTWRAYSTLYISSPDSSNSASPLLSSSPVVLALR